MKQSTSGSSVQTERMIRTATELIRCDTQNPPGREASVVPTVQSFLAPIGCSVEVFHGPDHRPSVLATYGDMSTHRPTLLINGHLDVVPVVAADWTTPPFEPAIRDGRLFGRGAADMKGGIAAAIEGLRACIDAGIELNANVIFHLVADEETGGVKGTEALIAAGRVQADACIIPEPTALRVSIAERGSFQATVEVRGQSGHGGDPAAGSSAIADAARMITALHLAEFEFQQGPHPLLGSPTCNVSMVSGGIAKNVIAPNCDFTIDRRTLPGETVDDVLASIVRHIEHACPGADYRVNQTAYVEASELAAEHPFPQYVRESVAGTGQPAEFVGLFLGTDGRFLRNQLEIPTVVCGPGSIRQAHTSDEWVLIAELEDAARTFARVFENFGNYARGAPTTSSTTL